MKEKKEIIEIINRNYYQYVEKKSRDYYNLFESQIVIKPEFEKESKMKERIGFYFFIMNNITRESDLLKLADNIVDTNFNEIFFPGLKAQDFGIDAYYINDKEEEPEIYLFNFKYRDEFGNGGQGENEIKLSKDFLDALKDNKKRSLKHKSLKMFNEIKSILDEKSSISIKLFFVSNDTHALNNTHVIESFKTSYDVDVIPIVISDIAEMTSLRPKEKITMNLKVKEENMLKHVIASDVSYFMSVRALELARITSNSEQLRMIEELKDNNDYRRLYSSIIDYNVLYDNVRGFLGKTTYNHEMEETLRNDPSHFYIYNNGITIVVDDIIESGTQMSENRYFKLLNAQIVNGGQTVRTIHNYINQNHNNKDFNRIKNAYVSLRIIKIGSERERIGRKVAEYTNSQNQILPVDLKSVAEEQFIIEKILMDSNIYFQRKRDIDIDYKKEYTHYINLEKMGQIIYSILGYPHRATSGKSRIFDKHYSLVYRNSEIDFTKCPEYVKKYYEIKNVYISSKYDVTDQKLFYILYILYNTTKKYKNLEELVECFEEQISNYKHTKDISDSRKLILLLFKDRVDKELI